MTDYSLKIKENGIIFLQSPSGEYLTASDLIRHYPCCRVIAFDAPMGAGKTTFIKQLCEELGTTDIVNSPTFAIVNVYDTPTDGEIYHFDCYRLKDIREAQDFGAEEYLYSGNLCLIEWPDIIEPLLPEDTLYVHIRVQENGDRLLTIED
ncbi:MAG: tRNA (adenosine(37)-N6)-threonylcarbamoyltransferase complex ATPase subunit type 1 TsaE [Paludibacteraceae bacterium]|nr:tRNA (adenosine(37)-N6)-threonylcarbamoyltransferase complex ATPase subunit type 1 TsaE [Paludibacteraceae bacterium]